MVNYEEHNTNSYGTLLLHFFVLATIAGHCHYHRHPSSESYSLTQTKNDCRCQRYRIHSFNAKIFLKS
jgi:hypothetical protein